MAGPITWRNVQAADFSEASNILDRATKTIGRGIDRVSKGVEGINQNRIDNRKDEVDQATQDAIQAFKSENQDVDTLRARQQAGDFTKDKLKGQYGSDVNLDRLIAGIESHDEELRSDFVKDFEFDKTQVAKQSFDTTQAEKPYVGEIQTLLNSGDRKKIAQGIELAQAYNADGVLSNGTLSKLQNEAKTADQAAYDRYHSNVQKEAATDRTLRINAAREATANVLRQNDDIVSRNLEIEKEVMAELLKENPDFDADKFFRRTTDRTNLEFVDPTKLNGFKVPTDPNERMALQEELASARELYEELTSRVKGHEDFGVPLSPAEIDRQQSQIALRNNLSATEAQEYVDASIDSWQAEVTDLPPDARTAYSSYQAQAAQDLNAAMEIRKEEFDNEAYKLPFAEKLETAEDRENAFDEVVASMKKTDQKDVVRREVKDMALKYMTEGYTINGQTYFPSPSAIGRALDQGYESGILVIDGIEDDQFEKAIKAFIESENLVPNSKENRQAYSALKKQFIADKKRMVDDQKAADAEELQRIKAQLNAYTQSDVFGSWTNY